MLKFLVRILLALLLSLVIGLVIGTVLRLRMERPVEYLGQQAPPSPEPSTHSFLVGHEA